MEELIKEIKELTSGDDKAEVFESLKELAELCKLHGMENDIIVDRLSDIVHSLRNTYGELICPNQNNSKN